MRLTSKIDPNLQSNLRILQYCSRFKTVKLLNSIRKLEQSQTNLLENPRYIDLRDFLEEVSRR